MNKQELNIFYYSGAIATILLLILSFFLLIIGIKFNLSTDLIFLPFIFVVIFYVIWGMIALHIERGMKK